MARDWPRLEAFETEEDAQAATPIGWTARQIESLYHQLPVGMRFEKKMTRPAGEIPVIDQSAEGIIGWHNDPPGVEASPDRPVVTFANHTCEMRVMRRSFSVIQNVFPLIGREGVCTTPFLYYGTKGRVHLEEYKGHYPDYRRKWIPVPPIADQRAIAHILGTLDDKIELNRRMNETLEAMARALFKSWFVDFDPVRAKARGETPAGMDPATAALFPSELQDSELGEIPKGWMPTPLASLATVTKGRSYKSTELQESDTALVTLKSFLRGGGYRADGLKPYVGPYKPEQVVRPGELVVAFTDVTQDAEVIGKPALVVQSDYRTLIASLDVGIVRPYSTTISTEFLYFTFQSDAFQNHAYAHTSGTTVLHLSKDAIPSYTVALPDRALVESFSVMVKRLFDKCVAASRESDSLAALRNSLLPRLLSGELSVTQAERIAEEAI